MHFPGLVEEVDVAHDVAVRRVLDGADEQVRDLGVVEADGVVEARDGLEVVHDHVPVELVEAEGEALLDAREYELLVRRHVVSADGVEDPDDGFDGELDESDADVVLRLGIAEFAHRLVVDAFRVLKDLFDRELVLGELFCLVHLLDEVVPGDHELSAFDEGSED